MFTDVVPSAKEVACDDDLLRLLPSTGGVQPVACIANDEANRPRDGFLAVLVFKDYDAAEEYAVGAKQLFVRYGDTVMQAAADGTTGIGEGMVYMDNGNVIVLYFPTSVPVSSDPTPEEVTSESERNYGDAVDSTFDRLG